MDELKFRRQAYSNPNDHSPEFIAAMADDPHKVTFIDEIKQVDRKITAALQIPVPPALHDNLLAAPRSGQGKKQHKRVGLALALVASIMLISAISVSLLRSYPVDLGSHALAHVYHEDSLMQVEGHVSYQEINHQLVQLMPHARFTQQPGTVFYSQYCDFQGVKSMHLILQGQIHRVSLFIIPADDRMQLTPQFADNTLTGLGFKIANSYLLIVGDNVTDLLFVKKEIKQSFI